MNRGTRLIAIVVLSLVSLSACGDDGASERPAGIPAGSKQATVTRVIDGDTIEVRLIGGASATERVRLIGIDTPEVGGRAGVECYGKNASMAALNALEEAETVWLEPDREELDQYGRALRYVWYVDPQQTVRFLNLDLVLGGYAEAYRYEPNTRHAEAFDLAELAAIREQRGMWGACDLPTYGVELDPGGSPESAERYYCASIGSDRQANQLITTYSVLAPLLDHDRDGEPCTA